MVRLLVAALALLFPSMAGCFSHNPTAKVSFAPTGPTRPTLRRGPSVKLYVIAPPDPGFEELGLIEVEDGSLQQRIDAALDEARRRGGDGLVMLGNRTRPYTYTTTRTVQVDQGCTGVSCPTTEVPVSQVGTSQVQTFVVIRTRPGRGALLSPAPIPHARQTGR